MKKDGDGEESREAEERRWRLFIVWVDSIREEDGGEGGTAESFSDFQWGGQTLITPISWFCVL
jgi:hypothetical protein